MNSTNKENLALNPEPEKPRNHILCIDITNFNKTLQFLLCTVAVFLFFLLYGYVQELIFTIDGFRPYGWFLTLVQFGFYSIFGYVETKCRRITSRRIPLSTYFLLAVLTLGTMGFSNASLGYLNYPTQVIFKCCKLIPVLVGGILIQGKRYGPLDFLAAVLMCVGLTMFTLAYEESEERFITKVYGLATNSGKPDHTEETRSNMHFYADSQVQPNFNTKGITMISLALLCDAVIGNVQEKSMKNYGATNAEVVLYSYAIGFVYLFVIMLLTGGLADGIQFFSQNPKKTYGYAFIFSVTGYLGIQIVLTLVRTAGAFAAVTVTTCRKAVTIIISFMFFSKPFTFQYLWSGLIVVLGIYLNLFSKKYPFSMTDLEIKVEQFIRYIRSKYIASQYRSGYYLTEI